MLNTDRLCMGCMNDNGGEAVCPICGYDSSSKNPENALPVKHVLNERFVVGKILDQNGEGITYIGWDNETNTVINIREFFPEGIAERAPDFRVNVRESDEYLYNSALLRFAELSNKLSLANDLPSIMPVIQIFEENNTSYCITKAATGISLNDFLIRNGGALKWDQARPLFLPLIATIKGLHDIGILHRGISPSTIIVGRDGRLRISGICISDVRTSQGELVCELFPGYSAIEQYGFDRENHDGTWTDVYALAATLFRVLIGNCPPEAKTRITDDNMSIPASVADSLPRNVLVALANALQILPEDRTQTVDELRRDLIQAPRGTRIDLSAAAADAERKAVQDAAPKKKKAKKTTRNYTLIAIIGTAAICLVIFIILATTVFRDFLFEDKGSSDPTSSVSVPSAVSIASGDNYTSKIKTYAVPDLRGKSFAEVTNDVKYENTFKFEIAGKSYSNKYKKGTIISQSVEAGTNVEKETTITVTISLGSKTVNVPSLRGKSKTDAYIALLELGFLPNNISFVDKYDDTAPELSVIETEPANGSSVYPEAAITVYINTYSKETEPKNDEEDQTFSSNVSSEED